MPSYLMNNSKEKIGQFSNVNEKIRQFDVQFFQRFLDKQNQNLL